MTWRVYIMPMVGDGLSRATARQPKYLSSITGSFACVAMGLEQMCVIAADVTNAQNTSITANTDCRVIPTNLDSTLNATAVTQTQSFLESANIPAQWVNTSRTYRTVLRVIIGMFNLMRRLEFKRFRFMQGAVLDDTVSSIPSARRTAIGTAASELGLDSSSIAGSTTIRELLRIYGLQFASTQIQLGGLTI